MSNILDMITIGNIQNIVVDADPSEGSGTPGPVGSTAQFDSGSEGKIYIKYGVNDTDWDVVSRSEDGGVLNGLAGRLPIYYQNGFQIDDSYGSSNNAININATSPSGVRTSPLQVTFPDPGTSVNAADVVLSEGAQTINGLKTFGDDTTFNQDVTVLGSLEVQGSLSYLNTTNTTIEDALVTLNKGGTASSASDSGLEFEEDGSITGYLKTTTNRLGYKLKAPGQTGVATLLNPAGSFSYTLPEETGVLTLGNGVAASGDYCQLAYWSTLNQIDSESGSGVNALTWDRNNNFLGINQSTPKSVLHVGDNTTSGTVGANSIILGLLNSSADVGASALIANGSAGANTASGVDSAAFGSANVSSGTNSFTTGSSNTASGLDSQAGGLGCIADGSYSFARGRRSKTNGYNGTLVLSDSQDADNLCTRHDQARFRFQGGYVFNKGLDNTEVNKELRQSSVVTTNATVTPIDTFTVPANSTTMYEAHVVGTRTGGTSGAAGDNSLYIRVWRIKSVAGVVTLDNVQSSYTVEDQNGWNCSISVTGSTVNLNVTGAGNNTVRWHANTTMYTVAY